VRKGGSEIVGLAAADAGGPIVVSSRGGRYRTVLDAIDLSGRVLWTQRFDGVARRPRISAEGTVWVVHKGPAGDSLTELTIAGRVLRSVTPEHQPGGETLAAFVLLPDGFCVAWAPRPDRDARLAGLGLDHFEGRSWTGWHRHVTLVTAAHLFITMLRLAPKRMRRPDPLQDHQRAAIPARHLDRRMPHLPSNP
jgi:hypothetical protein